jgi:protein-tyrosine phosphatase
MRYLLDRRGLAKAFEVDSAGTAAYHAGERPDSRSRSVARSRGVDLPGTARQFEAGDFDRFDYVLAMDTENYAELRRRAPSPDLLPKLMLLLDFDALSSPGSSVPDPYYGGARGFEEVLDLCERACQALLSHVKSEWGLE